MYKCMLHIRIQTPMYVACTEVYRFEQRCADLNRGVLILTGVYRFEQRCTGLSRGVQI